MYSSPVYKKPPTSRYEVEVTIKGGTASKDYEAKSHIEAVLMMCKEASNTPVLETLYIIDLYPEKCNIRVFGPNPRTEPYFQPGDRFPDQTFDFFTQFFLQKPGDTTLYIGGVKPGR